MRDWEGLGGRFGTLVDLSNTYREINHGKCFGTQYWGNNLNVYFFDMYEELNWN